VIQINLIHVLIWIIYCFNHRVGRLYM